MSDCLFCRIASGEIPSKKVFEDEDIFAFHDIHPVTPVHFLIIPKMHIASLAEAELSHVPILGKMLALSGRLAREQGLGDGFRSIVNTGRIGRQEVYHLHIHILGGPEPLGTMIRK
ncbi:MAG: histidine triad nucleotide-binding protein [Proteobacteria bacterium]|nr:histidine triad nucleotide-binding protein [Pseudomonadota bacterium]